MKINEWLTRTTGTRNILKEYKHDYGNEIVDPEANKKDYLIAQDYANRTGDFADYDDYEEVADYTNEDFPEYKDKVECQWCHELYPESEIRYEVDLGPLCHYCEEAIKSRGEELTFRENLNEAAPRRATKWLIQYYDGHEVPTDDFDSAEVEAENMPVIRNIFALDGDYPCWTEEEGTFDIDDNGIVGPSYSDYSNDYDDFDENLNEDVNQAQNQQQSGQNQQQSGQNQQQNDNAAQNNQKQGENNLISESADENDMISKIDPAIIKAAKKMMEEFEDEVECANCFELTDKSCCIKNKDGEYICYDCAKEMREKLGEAFEDEFPDEDTYNVKGYTEETDDDVEADIDFLLQDEDEAIEGYNDVINSLSGHEHLKKQLGHIRDEEIAHSDFLAAAKDDFEADYEDFEHE